MRVVFMGTPDISAVCLEKLLAQHFSVVGVYTKPDAPQNRGMRLAQAPVKKVALAAGLPVFQPERLRDPETVQTLRDLHPDVIAVVAYGKILPPEVLEIPPRGCINIHASILPALRGSGPVQWAILQGMTETGVTAMYMAPEMDAGDVIAVSRTPIDPEETAQSLLSRLAELGGELLCGTLHKLENGPWHGIAAAVLTRQTNDNMADMTWPIDASQKSTGITQLFIRLLNVFGQMAVSLHHER